MEDDIRKQMMRRLKIRIFVYPIIILIVAWLISRQNKQRESQRLEHEKNHVQIIQVIDPAKPAQLIPAEAVKGASGSMTMPTATSQASEAEGEKP